MSLTRARSRLALRMRLVSSRRLVKFLNLLWKRSLARERSSSARSSVVRSRRSRAFISEHPPHEDARGDRELVGREPERLARDILGHAADFVHHPPRFDHGGPLFGGRSE